MPEEPDWDKEIIIDTREKKWEKVFDYLGEIDAPPHRLDTVQHKADYVVRNEREMGIQRKTMNDFVGSIGDLSDHMGVVRDNYELSALLLEEPYKTNNGVVLLRRGNTYTETISVENLQKFILSQQLRGTMIFHTMDLEETAQLLVYIYEYLDGEVQNTPGYDTPAPILTMFPGIGPVQAGRIHDSYDSVGEAIENVEKWDQINGIGEKTVEDVLDWLY